MEVLKVEPLRQSLTAGMLTAAAAAAAAAGAVAVSAAAALTAGARAPEFPIYS